MDYKEEIKITPNAIKQALDDLLEENDMYKRENKHLKDLQKNMDKQYEELEEENYIANKTINELSNKIAKIVEDKKQIKERIDKTIEKLQLLIDIGFDYDGLNQVSSLKSLIDELVSYAIDSRDILKGDSNESRYL